MDLSALNRLSFISIATLFLSLSTHAAVVNYEGIVDTSTGALLSVVPVGTQVLGPIEYDDGAVAGGLVGPGDILGIDISVGNQCFTTGADTSGCPLIGAYVPITSIDAAAITFGGGAPTGGLLDFTAFSSAFGVFIPIAFDLTAGTFFADAGALGTASGTFAPAAVAPVPIPAAAWLFGSALLALVGVAKRKTS